MNNKLTRILRIEKASQKLIPLEEAQEQAAQYTEDFLRIATEELINHGIDADTIHTAFHDAAERFNNPD